jgi:hypothetical protein
VRASRKGSGFLAKLFLRRVPPSRRRYGKWGSWRLLATDPEPNAAKKAKVDVTSMNP